MAGYLVLLSLFLSSDLLEEAEPEPPVPAWIHCTPTSVEIPGLGLQQTKHAVAMAVANAGPGTLVFLDPGDYPPMTIGFRNNQSSNANTRGGAPNRPITIEGTGLCRIMGRSGDAIGIAQERQHGWITFKHITIVPGARAGILFYRQYEGGVHRGYSFEDCHITGQFTFLRNEGRRAKWGVWGHSMADFRFAGVRAPAKIEKISDEHAFYIQNHRGPIVIENVQCKEIGRTFCQFTARSGEGPPGRGDITIRNCRIIDPCIAPGDGYKGGSAFTFAGRLQGTILLEKNTYRTGFRKDFRKLTTAGIPFGTGALVAWDPGEGQNGTLILRDNSFTQFRGTGDRALISIGGTRGVRIIGRNTFQSGGEQPALTFDPVNDDGQQISRTKNGPVFIAPHTEIKGEVWIGGKEATDAQLARLKRQGQAAETNPKKKKKGPKGVKRGDEDE